MEFALKSAWQCRFLDENLRTYLPRRVVVRDPAKLFEMAARGGLSLDLESRQALELAIAAGHGGIWLRLTDEQYRKLKNC